MIFRSVIVEWLRMDRIKQPFNRRPAGMQMHLFIYCLLICFFVFFLFVCFWRNGPQWARSSSFMRFLDHTQRRTTVGRTSLGEWSARRIDHYLTTHNAHSRQTSMPPVGFEPTTPAGERSQNHALDGAAFRTGQCTCSSPSFSHRV